MNVLISSATFWSLSFDLLMITTFIPSLASCKYNNYKINSIHAGAMYIAIQLYMHTAKLIVNSWSYASEPYWHPATCTHIESIYHYNFFVPRIRNQELAQAPLEFPGIKNHE